jgi:predicted secreted protein
MTVAPDDTITVTLCSNPSTGFAWERATISNPGVLGLSDQRLIQPQAATPIVGAAGQERWQFDVRYNQPWDGGTNNAWSLTLRVTASS